MENQVLKTWADGDWTKRLTKTLTVGMVDDDQGAGEIYKPWYISLTQIPDALAKQKVRGLPRTGKSILLTAADVVTLVKHLLESELVRLTEAGPIDGHAADYFDSQVWQQRRIKSAKKTKRSKFI